MGTPPISFHDTGGECDTLGLLLSQFFYPLCLLTPRPMGTPPISFHDTGGECDTLGLLLSQFFYPLCLLTPPSYGHSPYILCCATPQCCGARQGEE